MTSVPTAHEPLLLNRTILLVEDDPIVGIDVVDSLEQAGATVLGPFETIAAAMKVIAGETMFDAALLDAHLADGPALRILDALDARGTPYVMVTGDENFGIQYSPDAPCVPKPVDMPKVLHLLADMCAERAPP